MLWVIHIDTSGKLVAVRLSIEMVFKKISPFSETVRETQIVSLMLRELTRCLEERPLYMLEINVFSKQVLLAFLSEYF